VLSTANIFPSINVYAKVLLYISVTLLTKIGKKNTMFLHSYLFTLLGSQKTNFPSY